MKNITELFKTAEKGNLPATGVYLNTLASARNHSVIFNSSGLTTNQVVQAVNAAMMNDPRFKPQPSQNNCVPTCGGWYVTDVILPDDQNNWTAVVSYGGQLKKLMFTIDDSANVKLSPFAPEETRVIYNSWSDEAREAAILARKNTVTARKNMAQVKKEGGMARLYSAGVRGWFGRGVRSKVGMIK